LRNEFLRYVNLRKLRICETRNCEMRIDERRLNQKTMNFEGGTVAHNFETDMKRSRAVRSFQFFRSLKCKRATARRGVHRWPCFSVNVVLEERRRSIRYDGCENARVLKVTNADIFVRRWRICNVRYTLT